MASRSDMEREELLAQLTKEQRDRLFKYLEAGTGTIEDWLAKEVESSEDVLVDLEETIREKQDLILKIDEAKRKQLKTVQIELDSAKADELKKINEILEHFFAYPQVLKRCLDVWAKNGVSLEFRYLALIMLSNYDPTKKTGIEIKSAGVDGQQFNIAYFKKMLKLLHKDDRELLWEISQLYKSQIEDLRKGYAIIITFE